MFFRDVLRRWRQQGDDAIDGGAAPCVVEADGIGSGLLAELAADSEDFAELAAVLKVDLAAVLTALTRPVPPCTPDELVATLTAAPAQTTSFAHDAAGPTVVVAPQTSPLGGGEEAVGWGRWTRARGGARVHHDTVELEATKAVRPALAAS